MARLSGRPLLDTAADAALFVDRDDDLARLAWAAGENLNSLVVGEPGTGKTSLLRRLQREWRAQPGAGPVHFLDLAGARSAREVLAALADRLGRALPTGAGAPELPDLLALVAGATEERALVLADGLPAATAHPLFGQLRDELWQLPLTWVVSCTPATESGFLTPPADAFFETVVRLGPLPPDVLTGLLRARVARDELDDAGVAEAVALADGSPRRALEAVRALLADPGSAAVLRSRAAGRRDVLDRLGRPAAMLLSELEALGSASASDEVLLDRLGWTRGRASQVFAQLEDSGLVASHAPRNGAGRPRKIYRPVGPLRD